MTNLAQIMTDYDIDKLNVTLAELDKILVSGTVSAKASIKASKESSDSKTFTLRFKLVNVPLSDVMTNSLSKLVINWQNNNRKNFDKLVDGTSIDLDYTRPASQYVDPELAIGQKLASMDTAEAREAYIAKLLAKASE